MTRTENEPKYIIDIPYTFGSDHEERSLPSGERIKTSPKIITFGCTAPELREWLSDATFYSDCAGVGWNMGSQGFALGMQSSARATVKRVLRCMKYNGIPVDGDIADYDTDAHGNGISADRDTAPCRQKDTPHFDMG